MGSPYAEAAAFIASMLGMTLFGAPGLFLLALAVFPGAPAEGSPHVWRAVPIPTQTPWKPERSWSQERIRWRRLAASTPLLALAVASLIAWEKVGDALERAKFVAAIRETFVNEYHIEPEAISLQREKGSSSEDWYDRKFTGTALVAGRPWRIAVMRYDIKQETQYICEASEIVAASSRERARP